jgi:DeoR/GlpR family transcriptional regulator of sugar metabolism
MARSGADAERRRAQIAALLQRQPRVSNADLARRFRTHIMTVRRDLETLEREGRVVRCYGGAVPAHRITLEFAFDARYQRRIAEKQRIAEAAAALVRGGQVLFLDTGTTTLEVARAVARRAMKCRVATSSLVVASALWACQTVELHLIGGQVRQGSPDMVGPAGEILLGMLTADIAFLGSDGLDPATGSYADDFETARVTTCMAEHARRVVVVSDAEKLGRRGGVRCLPIKRLQTLITDRSADRVLVARLRRAGVEVILV